MHAAPTCQTMAHASDDDPARPADTLGHLGDIHQGPTADAPDKAGSRYRRGATGDQQIASIPGAVFGDGDAQPLQRRLNNHPDRPGMSMEPFMVEDTAGEQ
jgi:hypothetical protein